MKRQSPWSLIPTTVFAVTALATAMAASPLASQKPPIPDECDEDNPQMYICSIEPGLVTWWPYTPN